MDCYIEGNLSASLFPDILEAASEVEVLLYALEPNCYPKGNKSNKELSILTDKEVRQKKDCLIGSGFTDDEGNYSVKVSNEYIDKAISVDFKLLKAPRQKSTKHKPIQVNVRTLKPIWRTKDYGKVYKYNYSFPFEFWYRIRTLFDAWTIYGRINLTTNPINKRLSGYKVIAMDVDWIKDDFLGEAMTDLKGNFRIDYDSSDFKVTFLSPLINIETPVRAIPGPGVYFKVLDENDTEVYVEDRKMGHSDTRKNIHRSYFVKLELNPLFVSNPRKM